MPTSRVIWAVVFATVASVPGYDAIRKAGAQSPDATVRIVRIDIQCGEPFDEEGVRRLLPFDIGDEYEPGSLEETRRLLALRGLFDEISVDAEPAAGGAAIRIRLRRMSLVNRIRFQGNDAVGDEDLRRLTRLRGGFPLTPEAQQYAIGRIRERYQTEGFPGVTVDGRVSPVAPGEVDVVFDIVEGPPVLLAAVEILGAPEPLLERLRHVVELDAGDRYVKTTQAQVAKEMIGILRDQRHYEARVGSAWKPGSLNQGRLTFEIQPGPLFEIDVRGNEQVSVEELLEPMHLRERSIVTDGTWRQAARRAVRLYQERGFHQAQVKLAAIDASDDVKTIRYDVSEGPRFRIWRIGFDGNRALSDSALREVMQTRPPSWIPWHSGVLIDEILDQDLERIAALYRSRGFQLARVRSTTIRHDADSGGLTVRLHVEEGDVVRIAAVHIEHAEVIAGKVPVLRTAVGAPLSSEAIEEDRRVLLAAFAATGHADAEVRSDVQIRGQGSGERAASVSFLTEPHGQLRVGRIVVQGNFDTRAEVILRELPFAQGDILDPDRLLVGQGRVYQLGLFRSVTVRAVEEPHARDVRDVVVRVAEKLPGSFQWGLGYNTRDGFRGVGQVGYHNLQGLGRSISLRAQLDVEPDDARPSQYLSDISYRQPRLLETLSSGSLKLLAQRSEREIDDFKLQRIAFIPSLERAIGAGMIAGLAWQIDQTEIFDLAREIAAEGTRNCSDCRRIFDDDGKFFSMSLDPFLVRNALDDEFRPTSGTYESLRFRIAPGGLATDVPIVKAVGQHSQYVPLGEYFTFIYAVRFGWARALENGRQVPIQERFFLGGRATVRGFDENAVGPEARGEPPASPASTGDTEDPPKQGTPPLGGDVSVNLNGEVRFPLLYGLRGAVFVDGGGVYLQTYNARGERFREAAGVGLRYMTPVGPLSLDYGFKLDRRGSESLGQIHFSVGRVF